MNINMILYTMENFQNAKKVMLEKRDCKIELMNIWEKIVSLTFYDTPTKKIAKMCPETISWKWIQEDEIIADNILSIIHLTSGIETFKLNFSCGFRAFWDVWDGVLDKNLLSLTFTLPIYLTVIDFTFVCCCCCCCFRRKFQLRS